jgi:hypothetical protein
MRRKTRMTKQNRQRTKLGLPDLEHVSGIVADLQDRSSFMASQPLDASEQNLRRDDAEQPQRPTPY